MGVSVVFIILWRQKNILLTLDTERGLVLLYSALGPVPGAAVVHPGVLPGDARDHELAGDQTKPSLHPNLHRELVLLRSDVLPVLLPPDAHLAHVLALHGAVEADLVPEEDNLECVLRLGHLPRDPGTGACVQRSCNNLGQSVMVSAGCIRVTKYTQWSATILCLTMEQCNMQTLHCVVICTSDNLGNRILR